MKKTKRCCFCRSSLDRHVAVFWDGFESACITLKNKATKEQRDEYFKKLKPAWAEWGRAFGGDPEKTKLDVVSTSNGHGL